MPTWSPIKYGSAPGMYPLMVPARRPLPRPSPYDNAQSCFAPLSLHCQEQGTTTRNPTAAAAPSAEAAGFSPEDRSAAGDDGWAHWQASRDVSGADGRGRRSQDSNPGNRTTHSNTDTRGRGVHGRAGSGQPHRDRRGNGTHSSASPSSTSSLALSTEKKSKTATAAAGDASPSSSRGVSAPGERPTFVTLNQQLRDAKSCEQMLQTLRNQPTGMLTAINVATAWVRLANLQSRKGGSRAGRSAAAASAGHGGRDEVEGAAAAQYASVVQELLEPTAAKAAEMDVRQVSNMLWAMAKLGDGVLQSRRNRSGGVSDGQSPAVSPDQALQLLQQRTVELLQLLAPPPRPSRGNGGQDADSSPSSRSGDVSSSSSSIGGSSGPQELDIRDATQLWYGMASLTQHPWSDALRSALEEATLQAMEAAFISTEQEAPADVDLVPERGSRRTHSSSSSGRSGSSTRRTVGSWAASATAAAQIVFRMAFVSGVSRMSPSQKARLAAVINAMSYDDVAPMQYDCVRPQESPDCLLVGAQLLRLELPLDTVRRLHDMVLALPPAAAARTGRTAMARALNSAVGLGLQPSPSQARRWQQRLLDELGGGGDSGGDGGVQWTCEGLSWTMLALSGVRAYLPDEDARMEFLGALRRLVRQLRTNDASRLQRAMEVWGLRLPEREAALLRQKAGGGGGAWEGQRPAAGAAGRGGETALRSWGFRR